MALVYYSAAILTLCIPDTLPVLVILPGESRHKGIFMMGFGVGGRVGVIEEYALVYTKECLIFPQKETHTGTFT